MTNAQYLSIHIRILHKKYFLHIVKIIKLIQILYFKIYILILYFKYYTLYSFL